MKRLQPKDTLFIELIASKKEKRNNRNRYQFALEKGFKFVVTNPIYFLEEKDYLLHKTLTAIRLKKTIDNLQTEDLADDEFYFKDPSTIEHGWRNLPEALNNSQVIAKGCKVDLKLSESKFPVYSTPENISADTMLWNESFKGLEKRFHHVTDSAIKRLEMELSVISEMGFSNYFLIVWDIVNEAKRRGNDDYRKRFSCQ